MHGLKLIGKLSHFVRRPDRTLTPLIVNSMPKAGTNLVEELLCRIGYRRAFCRCLDEHNYLERKLTPSPGILYLAHLPIDLSTHYSGFSVLGVKRNLYYCIKSYVNYMFIDERHPASSFVVGNFCQDTVERLIFSADNPLGRPLVDEYVRFFRNRVLPEAATVDYDDLLAGRDAATKLLSRVTGASETSVLDALRTSLQADTPTKNTGKVSHFESLPADYIASVQFRVSELEREA